MDAHPPLYFAVLHTVCSFFNNRFSSWFGMVLNILFVCITIPFLFKTCQLLSTDIAFYVPTIVVIITSVTVLSQTTFIRMYVMAMMSVSIIAYILCKWLSDGMNRKIIIASTLTFLLGGLTQYYVIVYSAIAIVLLAIYFFCHGRKREILPLILSFIVSNFLLVLVFPGIISHAMKVNTFMDGLLLVKIKKYWFLIVSLILISVSLILLTLKKLIPLIQKWTISTKVAILLLISSVIYVAIILFGSMFFDLRYFFPIFPISHISVCYFIYVGISKWNLRYKNIVFIVILMFAFYIPGHATNKWHYLFRESEPLLEKVKQFSNLDCILVYNANPCQLLPSYYEIKNYKSSMFVEYDSLSSVNEIVQDSVLVYASHFIDSTNLFNTLLANNSNSYNIDWIGIHGGIKSYLLIRH